MRCNLAADLIAMAHRMTPVQSSPDPCIVDLAHQRVETVIRPFRLNYLGHGTLGGPDRPGDLVRTQEGGDDIRDGRRPEPVRGRILRMIYGE